MTQSTITLMLGGAGAGLGCLLPMLIRKIDAVRRENNRTGICTAVCASAPWVKPLFCLASAAAWAVGGLTTRDLAAGFLLGLILVLALLLAVIDLRVRVIPNELVLALLLTGVALQVYHGGTMALFNAMLTMVALALLFLLFAALLGFGMVGAGDVKLAAAMGMVLGYPAVMPAMMIMSTAFAFVGVAGLLSRRLTMKSMLPFAPFLMLGMVVSLIIQ